MTKSMGARKTIARIRTVVQREEWLFNFKSHFGLDDLFNTERLAAPPQSVRGKGETATANEMNRNWNGGASSHV